jgi:hypothetical protein
VPRELSPQLARAYELLADGEWHEREQLVRELGKVIPPGVALRYNEARRRQDPNRRRARGQPTSATAERVVSRSTSFLVEAGRRRLAFLALRAFVQEERDGAVYVHRERRPRA